MYLIRKLIASGKFNLLSFGNIRKSNLEMFIFPNEYFDIVDKIKNISCQ